MARITLILGETGSGKSHSIKELDPQSTFILKMIDKDLPFRGSSSKFPLYDKASNTGNVIVSHSPEIIKTTLNIIPHKLPNIRRIIIDDFQYIMSYEFMEKAKEKGYDKFTSIAQNTWEVIKTAQELKGIEDVVFLAHSESIYLDGARFSKIKTVGKLLDEKITIEGMFTIVLFAGTEPAEEGTVKHFFITNTDGTSTAKSPEGMFPALKIDNDLNKVLDMISEYYI